MDQKLEFILNNKSVSVEINVAKTLLDFIRNDEGLKGTKEGCREGDCGACTVLLGEIVNNKLKYKSINSCLFPIGKAAGKHIVTIEGLNDENNYLTPIQKEFNEEGASQCGFCTPGFVNSLTGYVIENNKLEFHKAENAIAGNICRCTGYASIKRATENVIEKIDNLNISGFDRIKSLVDENFLPKYFLEIEKRLVILGKNELNDNLSKNIIGGGTDLFVQKAESLLTEEISFSNNGKLNEIKVCGNNICIGGSVTIEQVKNSPIILKYFPTIDLHLNLFASLPIRNSATIAGNIVNASPIGDSTALFLALNSNLTLNLLENKRIVKLSEFYKGYKNLDLQKGEFLEEISFEIPNPNTKFNFEKVSKRTYLDIASVNTAIKIETENNLIKSVFLSAGGVSPIPLFLKNSSNFLTNKIINTELVLEVLNIVQSEISPISDIRGSAEYKRILLNQLIKAHFIKLFPELINVEEMI
ncbi:MAG: FAD binding domain-containing protein [Bacteroidetes bacterium]|nr:FAD binding domain-containing protein [Bacteroidota bacterium]MBU1115037.1 FAD binding domain-containing protein [Bacteroidota bacterium]MBU1799529.1 FAD binding domain-containing protein [Bacteroidota bacterium]